jgi:uncharacterized protein YcfL
MKKSLAIVAAVLFALAAIGCGSSSDGKWTDEQAAVREALEMAGNDPSKLDPEMKARYDKIVAENPMTQSRSGAPASTPATK